MRYREIHISFPGEPADVTDEVRVKGLAWLRSEYGMEATWQLVTKERGQRLIFSVMCPEWTTQEIGDFVAHFVRFGYLTACEFLGETYE